MDNVSENLPFVAPCRSLPVLASVEWLRRGWQDFRKAPRLSMAYGLALAALSWLIALATWRFGTLGLYLGLATGFVFVGPVLALGLYSISRQLALGFTPRLGYCLREGRAPLSNLAIFSVVLLVVLLVWARAAAMVHVFFPVEDKGLAGLATFLAIGSAVGAVFSAIVFAASAFSLPMLLDRQVDAVTAVVRSVHAVLRNKAAMLVWAGILVLGVLIGFLTGFLAFVVGMPVLGYATWHAYTDTLDASAWPQNDAARLG